MPDTGRRPRESVRDGNPYMLSTFTPPTNTGRHRTRTLRAATSDRVQADEDALEQIDTRAHLIDRAVHREFTCRGEIADEDDFLIAPDDL